MAFPVMTEFYWRMMGRGKPIVMQETWAGAAPHTALSITPDASGAILVKYLDILVTDNFALASDSIRVHYWGNFNSVTYIDLTNLWDIIAYGSEWDPPHAISGFGDTHRIRYLFEPPIPLWSSDSDTFEVEVTGSPAITGTISVKATGWQITEAEAGFDEDW